MYIVVISQKLFTNCSSIGNVFFCIKKVIILQLKWLTIHG